MNRIAVPNEKEQRNALQTEPVEMSQSIKFAFAVNSSNILEAKHFGDAYKYLVFKWNGKEIFYESEMTNKYKTLDSQEHGSQKKGKAIIALLKEYDLQVLVSRQFGKNIKMVNSHFIPILVPVMNIDEAIQVLHKHIDWIQDELKNNPEQFKLFTIRKGILKTIIKKDSPDSTKRLSPGTVAKTSEMN